MTHGRGRSVHQRQPGFLSLVGTGRITSTAHKPCHSKHGSSACQRRNPAKPSPMPCNTASANPSRSMKACPGSTSSRGSRAAACIAAILDRAVDPALLRLLCACALSAPTKSDLQQADIVILEEAGAEPPSPISFRTSRSSARRRRSWCSSPTAAGCRKSPRCAASRFPTIISTVLQRRGRRRHRACDIPARRRRGGPRHLPDQRDPRSLRESERDAEAAAAGHSGRRDVRRLAIGEGPHQPAAVARQHGA